VITGVGIELRSPAVGELSDVVRVLREWQHTDAPMQLHPGDLGWFWQFGAEATAAAVRTWSLAGHIVAVGLLDSPKLLRLTIAPEVQRDERLAQQVVADVAEPERGVLPAGEAAVEAPNGARVQDLLCEVGWNIDEPWTPLRRDLTEPVKKPDMRIEVVGPEQAPAYTALHRSSFGSPRFTEELWQAMAAGLPYADARCLLAYDDRGNAVAEVTVWSAGPGSPACSSRWVSMPNIAVGATARRSASPQRPPYKGWAHQARSFAPQAPMPVQLPPTSRPASRHFLSGATEAGSPNRGTRPRSPRAARRSSSGAAR